MNATLAQGYQNAHSLFVHRDQPPMGKVRITQKACQRFGVCVCKPKGDELPSQGYKAAVFTNRFARRVFSAMPAHLKSHAAH
eukprot:7256029-Pyramimonas_sp.AAC.1